MTDDAAIDVEGVRKAFGTTVALAGVDLHAECRVPAHPGGEGGPVLLCGQCYQRIVNGTACDATPRLSVSGTFTFAEMTSQEKNQVSHCRIAVEARRDGLGLGG